MMKMGRRKETGNGMQGVAVCLNLRLASASRRPRTRLTSSCWSKSGSKRGTCELYGPRLWRSKNRS